MIFNLIYNIVEDPNKKILKSNRKNSKIHKRRKLCFFRWYKNCISEVHEKIASDKHEINIFKNIKGIFY
jgi:hypothetical protein